MQTNSHFSFMIIDSSSSISRDQTWQIHKVNLFFKGNKCIFKYLAVTIYTYIQTHYLQCLSAYCTLFQCKLLSHHILMTNMLVNLLPLQKLFLPHL